MNLIVAGHQRSGTTLMGRVCDWHPEIALTSEFGNYVPMGQRYPAYIMRMLRRLWEVRARSGILPRGRQPAKWIRSNLFFVRYLWMLRHFIGAPIGPDAIEAVLRRLSPAARIVGDKYPDYIFQLGDLVGHRNVKSIVIYRDARDVAGSTLIKARGDWRGKRFAQEMNTPAKVARRWTQAIEIMESNQSAVFAVRYEDLIRRPPEELARLGKWLDVDPAGFPFDSFRDTSIGNYRQTLTAEELRTVMQIAGPYLELLGYEP